jgi:WD40 repeat protein
MFDYRPVNAPYPGLRPFEAYESEIFFGRDGHTDRLLEILQREHFLAVIGPSGCGKSSLVRAGLLPGLASGALGTGSHWRLALLRPGGQPMLSLAQALLGPYALGSELVGKDRVPKDAEDVTVETALMAAELRRGWEGLAGLVQTATTRQEKTAEPFNLLVLVDQFEEVFTYAKTGDGTDTEAETFVNLLLAARTHPEARIYVALTMRTDFLGQCVDFEELPEAINRAQYLTPRLNRKELALAITGPAQVFGGEVETGLANELIESIHQNSDQLPILQHALARMWREAERVNPDNPLIDANIANSDEVGGVKGALNRHANEVLESLTPDQQELAEKLFRAITEPHKSGGEDVRRPQTLAAIAAWACIPAESLKPVIEAFAKPEVSFLSYGRELKDNSVIDLTHEALIRQWETLKAWVADEFRRGVGYQRVATRAIEYQLGINGLLTGGDLARAMEWWNPQDNVEVGRNKPVLSEVERPAPAGVSGELPDQMPETVVARPYSGLQPNSTVLPVHDDPVKADALWQPTPHWAQRYSEKKDEELIAEFEQVRQFLIDSRDAEQRQREAEQNRLEAQAEAERLRAEQERQLADAARTSATRAQRIAMIAAMVALLAIGLAAAAYFFKQQAQSAKHERTISLFDSQLTHGSLLARVEDYAGARQVLAESATLDADIDPSRQHARNLLAGFTQIMGGQAEQVYTGAGAGLSGGAKLSPDGKLLAAAGERGTLVLFDAASGKLVQRLQGHDPNAGGLGDVKSVVFDPQGRWLFSGGDDGRIIRWSLPKGEKLDEWQAPAEVRSLALSPDGTTLASGLRGTSNQIILWNVADGKTIRNLDGHTGSVGTNGLAFSPDGKRLASASYDNTARVWDWQQGKSLFTLEGHQNDVYAVAFSPNGKILATASHDQQIILWDAETGHLLRSLQGHKNIVFGLAFNQDGNQLLSASRDNTLRLWNVASGITLHVYQGHQAGLWSVAIQDGKIYTAADDGTIRRWSLTTPEQWFWQLDGSPQSTALSPDGKLLAVGMKEGNLLIYRLTNGEQLSIQKDAHANGITRIAFNGDGSLLATAGLDDKAKLWQVQTDGKQLTLLHTLEGHTDAVLAVAFSPDGRQLATASYDGKIGLFEVATGKGRLFSAHQGYVESVNFNPQGNRLLSAGLDDHRLLLWDLDNPNSTPQPIAQAQDELSSASFSPDGHQIAAVGREVVVSLYDLAKPGIKQQLVGHEQAVYRAIYSPDGHQLATVSADRTVRLWDLDSQSLLFTLRLPTERQGSSSPLWDFDFRCVNGECWIAVPLVMGRVAVYRFPYDHLPKNFATSADKPENP